MLIKGFLLKLKHNIRFFFFSSPFPLSLFMFVKSGDFINACQSVLISQRKEWGGLLLSDLLQNKHVAGGLRPWPHSSEPGFIYNAKPPSVIQVSFLQSQSIICCSLVTDNTLPHRPPHDEYQSRYYFLSALFAHLHIAEIKARRVLCAATCAEKWSHSNTVKIVAGPCV